MNKYRIVAANFIEVNRSDFMLRPHLLYFLDYGSADLPLPTFNSEELFFFAPTINFHVAVFSSPSGMKSRKQTIVTVVILGMPYNFSII
jgi:hypothetical protein